MTDDVLTQDNVIAVTFPVWSWPNRTRSRVCRVPENSRT